MSKKFKFTEAKIRSLPPHSPDSASREAEYSDTEVIGFRINVSKSGRKFFSLRFTHSGKKKALRLGEYPQLGLTQARQEALKIKNRYDGVPESVSDDEVTLSRFVHENYLPWAYRNKASADKDEQKLRLSILPAYGELPLVKITNHQIQCYLDNLLTKHQPSTVNRHRSLWSGIYRRAIDWDYCTENPVKRIKPKKENNIKTDFLSKDNIIKLLESACKDSNIVAASLIKLLIFTGVRKSEALSAQWEFINFDKKLWKIPVTKSGKSRQIQLSDQTVSLLYDIKRKSRSRYVFPGKDENQPLNNPQKAFKRMLAAAGLSSTWRIHDLRHFTASAAISGGATLYEVQHLLGHASHVTTQRYAHLCDERLREITQQIASCVIPVALCE